VAAFGKLRGKISFRKKSSRVQPDGVFIKCQGCGATIVRKETEERGGVCKECNYHFQIGAKRRVELTLDENSFQEMFDNLGSMDPLDFKGKAPYVERLQRHRQNTGTDEGILCGTGTILGREVALAVTEYFFMSGSMGSVVGEKLTRITELALKQRLPLIIFSGSGGGARMDEGMLSLMQMAKTSAALALLRRERIPYIVVITNSSYGGTMASWASLGDVIIAEPRAMMGFTGPRVIKETLKVELPPGFQESEFMLRHGLIDLIVPRGVMREKLRSLVDYLLPGDVPESGLEPETTAGDSSAAPQD